MFDPVANVSVATTCCSLPNCNYFDSSSFTTTTRSPTSSLSCYVGVGPSVAGIPSNSQIVLCKYTLINYCSVNNLFYAYYFNIMKMVKIYIFKQSCLLVQIKLHL